ncbi:hypothetical protein TNCV_3165171 [Trichonephila clavipes]|nr:hypothetical protein TNCV_3165171 [Trichonephila clavipes]
MKKLTTHYSTTRGFLETDHVILNHVQVTRTTPELVNPSPNFHTSPMGGRFSLDRFIAVLPPLHGGSSAVLMTRLPRVRRYLVKEEKSGGVSSMALMVLQIAM